MQKYLLLFFIVFILVGCQTISIYEISAEKNYKIYKKLPCYFNGAKVSTSAQAVKFGPKGGRCCPSCKGYTQKKGTSIIVPRGTPVIAIADMELIHAVNRSANQNRMGISQSKSAGKSHKWTKKIMKPYDDVELLFEDKNGNQILYYHLMSTPLVPGFNKGKCKNPIEYRTETWKRWPHNCGGYAYKSVKKGDVIGFSGDTGGGRGGDKHFSLGIEVLTYRAGLITKEADLKRVAPEEYFQWESLPSNSDIFLLPVQSKSYLESKGY